MKLWAACVCTDASLILGDEVVEDVQLTRVLEVLVRGDPGLGHSQQRVLHDLDVCDGAVTLGILIRALTDALVLMAHVLSLTVAHDVAQS